MKAVKFWNNLTNDPTLIPDGWPRETREIADASEVLAGETAMTDEELRQRMESLSAAKEAWNVFQSTLVSAPLAARSRLATDTIADLQQALDNWAALTVAQQKAVLRRLVELVLLLLRENRLDLERE